MDQLAHRFPWWTVFGGACRLPDLCPQRTCSLLKYRLLTNYGQYALLLRLLLVGY